MGSGAGVFRLYYGDVCPGASAGRQDIQPRIRESVFDPEIPGGSRIGTALLGFLLQGLGVGDPTAYTYDYANVFMYVAGLLNMLVIVDVFDIAMGRKQ